MEVFIQNSMYLYYTVLFYTQEFYQDSYLGEHW